MKPNLWLAAHLIGYDKKSEIVRYFQGRLCDKIGLLCDKLCDFFRLINIVFIPGFKGEKSLKSGLLIFRGKKSKISRDFRGQIRGKIGRFRGIFAGKKSKFAEKSANFAKIDQFCVDMTSVV